MVYYLLADRLARAEKEDGYEDALMPPAMVRWTWFALPNSTKADAGRVTAPLLRKVIDFIRHHPDCYDTGISRHGRSVG